MAFSGNQITGLKAWGVMGIVQSFDAKEELILQSANANLEYTLHGDRMEYTLHGDIKDGYELGGDRMEYTMPED